MFRFLLIIVMALSMFFVINNHCFAESSAINNSSEQKASVPYKKTVIVGAAPGGIQLKNAIKEALIEEGFEVTDITGEQKQEYYYVGYEVGKAVAERRYTFGFVFCATGMGVSLVANKFSNVRCALCESEETARLSRVINNANVLSMGGNVVTPYLGKRMAKIFVNAEFSKGYPQLSSGYIKEALKRSNETAGRITEFNYSQLGK